jgi:hypothetical protein
MYTITDGEENTPNHPFEKERGHSLGATGGKRERKV